MFQSDIIISPRNVFFLTLADSLSLESEWQHISPGLKNSSQYPDQS